MWTTAAKATNGLLRQQGLIRLSQQAVATRCFAGKAATKKKDSEDKKNSASYFDRKEAQKAARTQRYQANLQIIEQRKHRRDDAPKDTLKSEFRSWFEQRRAQDQQWDRQARQQGKEWKIQVAVVLERLPQILPDKADWETEYDDLYSHLAQFGKEYPKEFSGTLSSGGPVSITDEELLALLPPGFTPAPRVTKADEAGNVQTLDRKLKDRVYLLVDGEFPTTEVVQGGDDDNDESLLQAAQRAVKEYGGKSIEVYCAGHAPMGVKLSVKDTDDEQQYFGTKTFFLRLQHDEGDVEGGKDFGWLDRSEIVEQMQNTQGEDASKFYQYLL